MLSTETRIKLQNIADRIAKGEEVSLSESVLIHKWADHNRSVYEMLRKSKREAFYGDTEKSPMDQFLHDLNLGDPDPSNHKSGFDGPEDLGGYFKAPNWTRRD